MFPTRIVLFEGRNETLKIDGLPLSRIIRDRIVGGVEGKCNVKFLFALLIKFVFSKDFRLCLLRLGLALVLLVAFPFHVLNRYDYNSSQKIWTQSTERKFE